LAKLLFYKIKILLWGISGKLILTIFNKNQKTKVKESSWHNLAVTGNIPG